MAAVEQPSETSEAEQFPYGITRSWLDDKAILFVKGGGEMQRVAIDTWVEVIMSEVEKWDMSKPIAVLHDLTHPKQGFTPYSQKRARDILAAVPKDHPTLTSIVLRNTLINQFISIFVRTVARQSTKHKIRIFTDYDEALKWVRDEIKNAVIVAETMPG